MPSSNDNSCFADERYAEFLRLFTAHQKWILGHLYHILHNYHDAEEVPDGAIVPVNAVTGASFGCRASIGVDRLK